MSRGAVLLLTTQLYDRDDYVRTNYEFLDAVSAAGRNEE